jgi:hypothetical protein
MPEISAPSDPIRRGRLRRSLLAAGSVVVLVVGGAIALSKPFQDGATGLFSKVADGVKDHPGGTLALSLGGVVLLWLSIGIMALAQELRSRPRDKD